MENSSLPKFFEVLPSKPINRFLFKNTISELGFLKFSKDGFFESQEESNVHKYSFFSFVILCILFFSTASSQTFPSSCTSGDLVLVGATLPPNLGEDACGTCTAGTTISRTLYLSINNKTGSTRTSFAYWGTLEIINADGSQYSTTSVSGCRGPIIKNSVNTVNFGTLSYPCGKSLRLVNLHLAWTSSNSNETCPVLTANPSTINPKCGILPSIQIVAGLDADFIITNATCAAGGSIAVSPFGGKAPYSVTIGGVTHSGIAANATTTFTNLPAANYSITITDVTTPVACTTTKSRVVGSPSGVTVNAGNDFTKTCVSNMSGQQIGEDAETGFTYSWLPITGLNDSGISNPTANPTATTIYTVTKTNTSSGCSSTDTVTVTVNNAAVTANAGGDFEKTCVLNTNGKQIGEASVSGFSYSWLPITGLNDSGISNPTANPTATTIYTITKTNTSSGCSNTDTVTVTVNNAAVTANAGNDFEKTCVLNTNGKQIGEASVSGFSYSWLPITGLNDAGISNPTANPSATTTYTVTKTYTSSGCSNTDTVTVTVNNAAVTANAGNDFEKTCVLNANGKQIGEASVTGFSYSWLPITGLNDAGISNPTANPSATTTYTVTKTYTSSGCSNTDTVTVTVNNAAVTANAGNDFEKTCVLNANGKQIGEASVTGFSYSWSPTAGLNFSDISNPSANPDITTTYTVTKTNISSSCSDTDTVTVTVNNGTVTANAGIGFTKTCISNTSGQQIGEASVSGFTYSWLPITGLNDAGISNPNANPSATTTYTVTKTNTTTGCSITGSVTVTVNTNIPSAPDICIVQPSLCAAASGSITILSPIGEDFEYSIDDGGSWQLETVFSGLGAGSVTGIKVKNTVTGCISGLSDCDDSECPISETNRKVNTTNTKTTLTPTEKVLNNEIHKVGFDVYPVPFKDQLNVRYNFEYSSNVKIEIFNTLGALILTKEDTNGYFGKEYNLNLSMKNGVSQMYFVKVTTNRGSTVKKIISSR